MTDVSIPKFRREFQDKVLFDAYKKSQTDAGTFDASASYIIKREHLMWLNGTYYSTGGSFESSIEVGRFDSGRIYNTISNYNGDTTLILVEKLDNETETTGTISISLSKTIGSNKVYIYPDLVVWQDDNISTNLYQQNNLISSIISGNFNTQPTYNETISGGSMIINSSKNTIRTATVYFGKNDDNTYLYQKEFKFIISIEPPSYIGIITTNDDITCLDIPSNADDWDEDQASFVLENLAPNFNKFMFTNYSKYNYILNQSQSMIKHIIFIPSELGNIKEIRDGNGFNYWADGNEGSYVKSSVVKTLNGFDYYVYMLRAATNVPIGFIQSVS